MLNKNRIALLLTAFFSAVIFTGCVPSNLHRGDTIAQGSNIVFFRVILKGDKVSELFIRQKGNWWRGAGRIVTAAGDSVYAIALPEDRYEMAQIKSTKRRNEIFKSGSLPVFTTKNGYINYAGTYTVTVSWTEYRISCAYDEESYWEAVNMFCESRPEFSKQYPFRNAVSPE